jgi:hypothetical protein
VKVILTCSSFPVARLRGLATGYGEVYDWTDLPTVTRPIRWVDRWLEHGREAKVTGFVTSKTRSRWPRGPHQLSFR